MRRSNRVGIAPNNPNDTEATDVDSHEENELESKSSAVLEAVTAPHVPISKEPIPHHDRKASTVSFRAKRRSTRASSAAIMPIFALGALSKSEETKRESESSSTSNGTSGSQKSDDASQSLTVKKLAQQDRHDTILETVKLLVIMAVPVLALIIVLIVLIVEQLHLLDKVDLFKKELHKTHYKNNVIKNFQKERGLTTTYLLSGRDSNVRSLVQQAMSDSDASINMFKSTNPGLPDIEFNVPEQYKNSTRTSWKNFQPVLALHRKMVLAGKETVADNLLFYTGLNRGIIRAVVSFVSVPSNMWKRYVAFMLFYEVTLAEGLQRAIGSGYFSSCKLPINQIVQLQAHLQLAVNVSCYFNPDLKSVYNERMAKISQVIEKITILKKEITSRSYDTICQTLSKAERTDKALLYFQSETSLIQSHLEVQSWGRNDLFLELNELRESISSSLLTWSSLTLLGLFLSFIMLVSYIISTKELMGKLNVAAKQLTAKSKEMKKQQKKVDNIIFQMLPRAVAGTVLLVD